MRWYLKVLFLVFISANIQASMLDFWHIKQAKESYTNGEYKKAANLYKKLSKEGNQEAFFNLGDSYYKSGEYKKALQMYKKIDDKSLEFKKLHNMGNCYANLNKIDDAIKSYEEALKIKKDKDTKYNLDLLKKKKQQQKKKDQKKKHQKNNNKKQNKRDKKNKQNKDNKQNKKNKSNQKDQKNRQNKDQKSKQDKKQKEDKKQSRKKENKKPKKEQNKKNKPDKKEQKKSQKPKTAKAKKVPISDMEERKYKKMLQQRGVNTLMLPMPTKGENHEETKPW